MDRFPHRQQLLYNALLERDEDVEIRFLYGRVYEDMSNANALAERAGGVRYMQQSLGPTIQRLNERLEPHGKVIRPGRTKQTYRLCAIG